MRRQPTPADCAREAQLVNPFGIVSSEAPRKHLPLPRVGGNFKTLQLPDELECGVLALHLRSRRNMLPAQEPAHELRRSDGLDLLAQCGNGEMMDAGEQAA